jgi:tRNA (cytidine/uridine-2'-O-)-methyltransferase
MTLGASNSSDTQTGSPRKGSPFFHVVLHEPEIPNNTGNIGRTCVATGCALHLIRPLGFDVSEKACRRAGLDYWPRLGVLEHDSWERYLEAQRPRRVWLMTTKTSRSVFDAGFERGDALVFGKESKGLPPELLAQHPDSLLTLPMLEGERSLNVATAVCATVYEGIRQLFVSRSVTLDSRGRIVPPMREA